MIPYKPFVRGKHVESILGTCKNMTKKVFNFNNMIPHSVRLFNPLWGVCVGRYLGVPLIAVIA
jgi:hypothetical protein